MHTGQFRRSDNSASVTRMPGVPFRAIRYCSAVLFLTRGPENHRSTRRERRAARRPTQPGVFNGSGLGYRLRTRLPDGGLGEKHEVTTVACSNNSLLFGVN